MGRLIANTTFALRVFGRAKGVTAMIVLSLALGLGANVAAFSVFNAMFLQGVNYAAPERLFVLETVDDYGFGDGIFAPNALDIKRQLAAHPDVTVSVPMSVTVANGDDVYRELAEVTLSNYFDTLGVRPLLGDLYRTSDDGAVGSEPSVVVSYSMWRERFAKRDDVLGKRLLVNGQALTIIGVAPKNMRIAGSHGPQLWIPWSMHPLLIEDRRSFEERRGLFATSLARIADPVASQDAQSVVSAAGTQLQERFAEENANRSFRLFSLSDKLWAGGGMMGMIGSNILSTLVLLIACANVANLLLARGMARGGEMAVRTALGATRVDTFRQLMTESLLLALIGGTVGTVLGFWGVEIYLASTPGSPEVVLDWHVAAYSIAVTLLTGLLFGLSPALTLAKRGASLAAHGTAGRVTASGSRQSLQSVLVALQVALSMCLLVPASMIAQSVSHMVDSDAGMRVDGVHVARIDMEGVIKGREAQAQARERLRRSLASLPGVDRVAFAERGPFVGGGALWTTFVDPGNKNREEAVYVSVNPVGPGLFSTLGASIEGRDFASTDRDSSLPVAIVNRAFVQRHFDGQPPIGRAIAFVNDDRVEIVGVVDDFDCVHPRGPGDPPDPLIFRPLAQEPATVVTAVIMGDATLGHATIEQALRREAPRMAILAVQPLRERLERYAGLFRQAANNIGFLALLGLFLASTGLYALMAYTVRQRTRDLGIRMALGAKPEHIVRQVVGRAATLVVLGGVIGLAGGATLSPALLAALPGASSASPLDFAWPLAVLVGVAVLASLLPARRATRIDPLLALRHRN